MPGAVFTAARDYPRAIIRASGSLNGQSSEVRKF